MGTDGFKGLVLLVDRDLAASRLATAYLVSAGYEVLAVGGVGDAVDRVRDHVPDLILHDEHAAVDERFPQLRASAAVERIPVLACVDPGPSAGPSEDDGDRIVKPFERTELVVKVDSCLRMRLLHDRLSERIVELASDNARLRKLTVTDALTGLYNRRHLEAFADREVERCGIAGEELSLVVLSILRFKAYNHECGHQAGNLVLRQVAGLMIEPARDSDAAARYRDSGFALLLPGCSAVDGARLADGLAGRCGQLPVGVAVGLATFPADGATPQALLQAAERRLDNQGLLGRYLKRPSAQELPRVRPR